ncbi:MAG: cytochrome c biogenesis protein ResB, partial [Candidatus Limnocylindrales bacterium]
MLQIILLVIVGVIGMTVTQLPDFAFRTTADYIAQMEIIHAKYDPAIGAGAVSILERLQVFNIFTAWWFSALLVMLVISIVVCTLNRTPKLWRTSAEIRVVQPDPFYNPILPDRAAVTGMDAGSVRSALRRSHFHIREAEVDGVQYFYGDRHRWTKMATLISHLGLILFLVAAAVTSRLGFESGIELTTGESQPVQAIGTPGLLVVKSFGFSDPTAADGTVLDYTTDLGVYQDGQLLARKVIRVNDPLSVGGFTFHQNGFRPAPDIVIRDSKGQPLWNGPVALDDSAAGSPHGTMSVPGEGNIGLEMLLTKASDGTEGVLFLPYRSTGLNPDGTPITQSLTPFFVPIGGVGGSPDTSFYVQLLDVQNATILVAKEDPGQPIVWFAFLSLITGLLITFYLPRRRIWARLEPSGELRIVGRSERYVDFRREFG